MPAILAAALALGLPDGAGAQPGTGASVAPIRPEPRGSAPRASLAEGVEDPATLIRLAESALRDNRLAEAADLLERAEARLLTRAELASEADRPAVGGVIGELSAARDAIGRRDAMSAASLARSALGRLARGERPAVAALPGAPASGPQPPFVASEGGGGPRGFPPLPLVKPPVLP